MAITVANKTSAIGLEFYICGYEDGSATPPLWSGAVTPEGHEGSSIVVDVSGYSTYGVGFFPVGWLPNNETSFAWSPQVTDNTTVGLAININ